MIDLGRMQVLTVVSRKPHGVYLAETMDAGQDARILLPAAEVPEGAGVGDSLEAFVYRDSADRLIATLKKPKVVLGGIAVLSVSDVTRIGAFLDWGLPKELLLPFHEQTAQVKRGGEVLAALYVDRSGRLAATMKVYPYLSTDSPYKEGDSVTARIYQVTPGHGAYAAVDDRYSGMIPEREMTAGIAVGDVLTLRVTAVKEDGKLDLAARERAYLQMEEDAEAVYLRILEMPGEELPYDDKADPDRIREDFGISKAAFKRAVGKLYKERRIVIEDGRIRTAR
ncbi:MAG: S1-like domain-containing RNA-binding protein [Lachnospiraceae bacterium]|nr:S1-like domain-containing RNA-binding protein [Lachnospiraceae bacterium]